MGLQIRALMEQTHAQVIEKKRPEFASRNKPTVDVQNPQ